MSAIPDRGGEVKITAATFTALALTAVLLRIYTRIWINPRLGVDDYFMVLAALFFIGANTALFIAVRYGMGRHVWDVDPIHMIDLVKLNWSQYVLFCSTMLAAKISIGTFLLRVTVDRIHRWAILSAMTATIILGAAFLIFNIGFYQPWDLRMPTNDQAAVKFDIVYTVVALVCDLLFAIIPIFVVWKARMSRKKKFIVIPIFGMALLASCANIVRLVHNIHLSDIRGQSTSSDFTYVPVDIMIWSSIEGGLAITAGSLATLNQLLKRVWKAGSKHIRDRSSPPTADVTPATSGDHPPPRRASKWTRGHIRTASGRVFNGPFSLASLWQEEDDDVVPIDTPAHEVDGISQYGYPLTEDAVKKRQSGMVNKDVEWGGGSMDSTRVSESTLISMNQDGGSSKEIV